MLTSKSTQALLNLEDSQPSVLMATLPGTEIRLWPLLRWPMARAAAELELGTVAVPRPGSTSQALLETIRAYLPGKASSLRIGREKKYLYVVGGGTLQDTPTGRENWLVGAFARTFSEQSVILQDQPINASGLPSERPAFSPTYTFHDSISRVNLATKLYPLKSSEEKYVKDVIHEVFTLYEAEIETHRAQRTMHQLLYRIARIRHLNSQFERTLDRIKPQVVFMDGASYGARSSLISILKDRNILVVEPQHGWIGPTHGAYNFGAAMSLPELKKCMPDVLMTFGDFWSRNIRYPTQVVSIGKPHLESLRMQSAPGPNAGRHQVLIVSSVFQSERLMRLTKEPRDQLPTAWTIRFRPHPSERSRVGEIFKDLVDQSGIEIDENSDVYESLNTASAVIGYASTVLYEALAFGSDVFVIDSPLADFYVDDAVFGKKLSDEKSLKYAVQRILGNSSNDDITHSEVKLEDYWKSHPIENFSEMLKEIEKSR